MAKGNSSFLGWSCIVLAILIALTQSLGWPGGLHYLWAVLVLIGGIWKLVAK